MTRRDAPPGPPPRPQRRRPAPAVPVQGGVRGGAGPTGLGRRCPIE
ncbi:hypothetical protein SFR_3181 [Streptomyces sp. FR-008]|nr:hypothetical protein SFR_3181 [Streptomyces sp. FR-008]